MSNRTTESLETRPPLTAALAESLLDRSLPFGLDWQTPALEMDESDRLLRLSRVKAILPSDNAIDEKTTHDVTLENYIRLALHAAGDRPTIDNFLGYVQEVLEVNPEGADLLAQQVFWIWSPVAEIAGLYNHKTALEEAAFEVLLPQESAAIAKQYDRRVLEGDNGLLTRMQARLKGLLDTVVDDNVSYTLSARPKSNYSTWRKLRKEQRETAEIFDLLGLRVVIDGEEDLAIQQCYAAMVAITAEFETETSRVKDYIASPKANGYQSIHLNLHTETGFPFELQIRTRSMDLRAGDDSDLSHQLYDATYKETPGKLARTYVKVPRLYQWRNEAARLIQENDGRTEAVMGDQILFFRADGNLYKTQSGSNALDASFRIHSRRALRTRSIDRNGKPIRLNAEIRHGDVIGVDYWPEYPTQLDRFDTYAQMVSTTHALKALERGRRQLLKADFREIGRNIVLAMVTAVGLDDPFSQLKPNDKRKLADMAGVPNFDNLLEIIGAKRRNGKPSRVARWIDERSGVGVKVVMTSTPESVSAMLDSDVIHELVIPSTGSNLDCRVAGCCSERIRRGDSVLVRPSRLDSVLKVHLSECVNVRDNDDTIACSWSSE